MKARFWLFIIISVCAMIGAGVQISLGKRGISAEASERNEEAIFHYLLPVVYSSGKAVRLYYRSDCRMATEPLKSAIPFPVVRVQPPSHGKTGLAAVQEIFRKDKNVTIDEDSSGIIRIWIGKVTTGILGTNVSRLALDPFRQFNPDEVFNALVDTKEMQIALRSLRYKSIYNPSSSRTEPGKGYPHLPPLLQNMTAERVLDEVAKTWAGEVVVVYGVCQERKDSDDRRRFWLGWNGQIGPRGLR